MSALNVRLFGKLSLSFGDQAFQGLIPGKAKELFCYLLTHRQPIARESLAGTLWGDCTTEHSRSYLRKTLWQLQSSFCAPGQASGVRLLRTDSQWVSIHPEADIWLDIEKFEMAFAAAQNSSGQDCFEALQTAVDLYQGDLLEGWYQDWCLYDRERLQNLYLAMLGKLAAYSERRREYEKGIDYSLRILRCDRAHEIAHQHLMRLHYLSGDRAGALRHFEQCATALKEELGVQPSEHTRELYRQIKEDRADQATSITIGRAGNAHEAKEHPHLRKTLNRLQELKSALAELQGAVEDAVREVREALLHAKSPST